MQTQLLYTQKWLRKPSFDLTFLLAIPLVAIAIGYTVINSPFLFRDIFLINIMLLGYHHVISTYTRIAFSFKSLIEYRFMVFVLPFIVLGITALLAFAFGTWVLATVYLYWQWFHYTRQSYGISRFYMAKSGDIIPAWQNIDTYAMYLLPLTGILYRSYQSPDEYLFMPLETLSVSFSVVQAFFAISVVAIGLQMLSWVKRYRAGRLSLPYVLYILSHHAIFGIGYLLVEDINAGWLILNVWHNAQYIAFVWLYNNKKFNGAINQDHKIVSTLSQNGRFISYILVCLFITAVFYSLVKVFAAATQLYTALPMLIVLYMTINFHHYIVDAIIWKKKRC